MTDREAQEIVRMVESAWRIDYGSEGRELWRSMLYRFDAALATRSVAKLSERQPARPTIADLKAMILKVQADEAVTSLPEIPAFGGKPGEYAPEWVWVWSWLRYDREPREHRPLPQQSGFANPAPHMSPKEYEALRQEWKAAGSPKALNPIPLARKEAAAL